MRIQLVDPSAFTPPYDRALARALAAAGGEVELITSEFLHGAVPQAEGFKVNEAFYRRSSRRGLNARGRVPFKFAEHLFDMVRLRGLIEGDITHYQWLSVPGLDRHLLASGKPRVITAHYIAPPEPSARQIRSAHRVFSSMDAVIVHSEAGARRMNEEIGIPRERIRVIPHGSFDYLTDMPDESPLPAELEGAVGLVVLFFGLLRPYKGIDLLLDAMTEARHGELWIVGSPRMDITALEEKARELNCRVRWLPRFIDDTEIAPIMRRAGLLVLPYLDGEQSGVLYTGLAFGKAMLVSDVGGLGDVARQFDAARLVQPGDRDGLAEALVELTGSETERLALAGRAKAAAAGAFSWSGIAAKTIDLYRELLP